MPAENPLIKYIRRDILRPGVTEAELLGNELALIDDVPGAPPIGRANDSQGTTEFKFLYDTLTENIGVPVAGEWKIDIPITSAPGPNGGNIRLRLHQSRNSPSGARGLELDRPLADGSPHTVAWKIGGTPWWEMGMDFDDSVGAAPQDTDFVPLFSYRLAGDIVRVSHRTSGAGGAKYVFAGKPIGTPSAQGTTFAFVTDDTVDLGGMEISQLGLGNSIGFTQRNVAHRYAAIQFSNKSALIVDQATANNGDLRYVDTDSTHTVPTAGEKVRLYVNTPNTHNGAVGLNCNDPQGMFEVRASNDASMYNVRQTYRTFAYAGGQKFNRAMNAEVILDATHVQNFQFFSGGLGSSSTRSAPRFSSDISDASAIQFDSSGNTTHIVTTPQGVNQVPLINMSWNQSSGQPRIGFLGTNPAIRQSGGAQSAGGSYGVTEQDMLNKVYNAMRTFGFLT